MAKPRRRKPLKVKRPGALTAKAKRAGKSIPAYARAHEHDDSLTGRQSRFYLNVLAPATRRRSAKSRR